MKIKDFCTINPKVLQNYDNNLLVSFVPMANVSEDGHINTNDVRKYEEVKKGFTYFENGDVLLAKITPCLENGKGAVARDLKNNIGFGSTEFHVFRPDNSKVLSEWLYYFTHWEIFRKNCENNMTGSAGQKRVSKSYLENYEVKLPDLNIQKKTVNILDQINNLIFLRTQQLEQLDLLIKSRFVEMFGDPVTNPKCWEQKRFDQICENLDSRRIPITASERVTGIYPYYGASGIIDYVSDYIFDEDILLISEDGANLLARTTPIAFSVSGKVWVNNHAHVVKFENLSLQKYIEIYFSLIDISTYITGSAQPKLNQAKLNAIMFPIPDGKVLDTFNVFYKQVEFTKATVKQSLEWLNTLKAKLMQDFFG